ncbi:hypothetical protein MTR67_026489 [Solanum verrucosum]|uniref:Uncharacterized protein n=1 Tax=Solanum verrucosum TaxID=315347 RepID=A0AAF0QZ14_SOLVR|nr:hypothetical protein MTR67_026489 [Solanum verrucosum]
MLVISGSRRQEKDLQWGDSFKAVAKLRKIASTRLLGIYFILQRGGDTLILGVVDFVDLACATITLTALQGDFFLNDNNQLSNLR